MTTDTFHWHIWQNVLVECSLHRLPPHQTTHPLTSRLYFPQGAGSGGWLALSLGELKVNIQAIQFTGTWTLQVLNIYQNFGIKYEVYSSVQFLVNVFFKSAIYIMFLNLRGKSSPSIVFCVSISSSIIFIWLKMINFNH